MPGKSSRVKNEKQPLSLGWWTGGHGLAGIAQWPNPAIAVWAIASLLRLTGTTNRAINGQLLDGIATGALLVWALDEVLRGVSPIRRIMGIVVLAVLAATYAS